MTISVNHQCQIILSSIPQKKLLCLKDEIIDEVCIIHLELDDIELI